jgi:hypothetical protein
MISLVLTLTAEEEQIIRHRGIEVSFNGRLY